ncbi:MAG TPA: TrkA family potassium uptake protein [Longimicrobiales bacterium]|nr:TrkA family potassium uptake protein [Longimicrobiales bacterium]
MTIKPRNEPAGSRPGLEVPGARYRGHRALVIGCGRVGSYAAGLLSVGGAEVVVIDRDPEAFEALSPEFSGFKVVGDASELAILRRAGAADADVLFAATESDTLNILVTQVARERFGVETVVARVFLPEWEGTYRDLGIRTISPVSHAVHAFLETVVPGGAP